MKILSKTLLKTIFTIKGNFAPGLIPGKKVIEGIEIAPFKNCASAAATFSADLELNWAFRGRNQQEMDLKGRRTRENVPYLLRLFEDCKIPITWATVGHLFLENCSSYPGGMPHPEMPRPEKNNLWDGDWYRHDPCTDFLKDPQWYAPDLIEEILGSSVGHEIGTHSFSHIDFSCEYVNEELVRKEMEACLCAMAPFGLRPRSLVFPFNRMGDSFYDILSDYIICVRHRDKNIRLSYPQKDRSGVYRIYESMNLRSPSYYRYADKARIFIEEAIHGNSSYHLWFHPSDSREVFENELKTILEYICEERDCGKVWVPTMGDLAAYCEARDKMNLIVKRDKEYMVIRFECSLDQARYGNSELSYIIPAETEPRYIFIEDDSGTHTIEPDKLVMRTQNSHVVANVPLTAKSLVLRF